MIGLFRLIVTVDDAILSMALGDWSMFAWSGWLTAAVEMKVFYPGSLKGSPGDSFMLGNRN